LRTPVKTALLLVLSMVFVFSLGWLNELIVSTEAEVQRLWAETIVEAELLVDFADGTVNNPFGDITPAVWDMIATSGFLGDAYLEAVAFGERHIYLGVSHLQGLVAENTKTLADKQLGMICEDMEITFLPGFSEEDFLRPPDTSRGLPVGAVVHREMAEIWGIPLDNPFYFEGGLAQVIAVYDGGLVRGVGQFGSNAPLLIIPLEAHRAVFAGKQPFYGFNSIATHRPPYVTARFTIDPSRNREIEDFRNQIEPFLPENSFAFIGTIPLIMLINDDVLHGVVLPMERNLDFLQVLYPIAVSVIFVLSVGISVLSIVQNAKAAAIMRALGKTRHSTRLVLCAGQGVVFALGAGLGLVLLFAVGSGWTLTPLMQGAMYISGAVLGAVVGAVIITVRKPMELLQIKE
jgi:hypothetical protein